MNTLTGRKVEMIWPNKFEHTETVTPSDAAYWNAVAEELPSQRGPLMTDLPESTSIDNLAQVDPGSEREFLLSLGLLVERGDAKNRVDYVSQKAAIFYGATGLFQVSPQQIAAAVEPVIELFRNWVLPGRMWRAYLASQTVDPSTQLYTALSAESEEAAAELATLGPKPNP
jgi:hypothetical protein